MSGSKYNISSITKTWATSPFYGLVAHFLFSPSLCEYLPQVTRALMANENLRVALSFEDEWQRVNDTTTMIPNAGFGATGSFIENNPELAALFQSEYEKALVWIKENPEEAGQLAEKYLGLKSQLVAKALPGMGLTFKTALDSKEELDMFYQMLYDFDPSMIGANIPDDGMYYVE